MPGINLLQRVREFLTHVETALKLNDHKLTFFLVICFGLILRLFSLEDNGLWVDEIWSMNASHSDRSIAEIIQLCIADTHPPLFDLLLHGALHVTGDYEFTARYLSLIFGISGILLTYFYALRIFENKRVALISMSLIAFNYFHIIYSFEGRFYSLVYILSLVSFAELYSYLKFGKIKHLVVFALCNVLFVYTHYYGAIMLFVLSLIVLILWLTKQVGLKKFLLYSLACLVVLLAFIPWLPHMFSRVGESSWITEPRVIEMLVYFYLYSGKNPIESMVLFIPVVFGFYFLKKNKLFLAMALGAVWLGYAIPHLISVLSTPLLHVRYTIYYFPALFLLTAYFWDRLTLIPITTKKWMAAIVLVSMFSSVLIFSKETKPGYKDGWKEASSILYRSDADHIFTEHLLYLNYYLDYHGEKQAGDLNAFKQSNATEFWLLSTPYDSVDLIEEHHLIVSREYPLSNNFMLYKTTSAQ